MKTENTSDPVSDSGKPEKKSSLTKKAGIIVVSRAVSIVAQLLGTVILTRYLPKEDFGVLSFMLIAYATVLTLGQLGLPDSVFFFFEKLPKASRKSIALLIGKMLVLLSLFGMVVLLLIGLGGGGREGFELVPSLIWVFMLLLFLELPSIPLPNILIALDRAKTAGWLNVFIGVSQFMAMTIPLFLGQPVSVVVYALLLYGVMRMLLSTWIFFSVFRNEQAVALPAGMIKELLWYSIPLSLAQIFWSLNRQIDKYIVQWFLPVTAFAEYVVGAWEIPIIPTIAYSVASVMMPQMVSHFLKGERAPLLSLWFKSIRKVSVIVLPLVIVFLIIAEEFIILLFSEEYVGAVLPFRIYSLILFQRVASYSSMLKALGDTKVITYSAIYLLLINLVLSIPLVMWLGMAGPPIATLIANAFTWWYSLSHIGRLIKAPFSKVFPFAAYLKTLLVAAIAAIPAIILKMQLVMGAGGKLPLLLFTYLLTYLLFARLSGIIAEEDWARMKRMLRL